MKIIIDRERQVVGLLSYDDLHSEQVMRLVGKGNSRNEIGVRELMRPRESLQALDHDEMRHSTVHDVIETLQREVIQHYLVVEHGLHQIRGVISASDIARRLHININVQERPTFVGIFAALQV